MLKKAINVAICLLICVFFITFKSAAVFAADIIIDNDLAGYTAGYKENGAWGSSGLKGYNNSGTRYSNTQLQTVDTWARWTPSAIEKGYYKVYFYYIYYNNNDTQADISIIHNGVTEFQKRDLTNWNGTVSGWRCLGIYNFSGNGGEYVQLKKTLFTGKNIRADAVKFTPVSFTVGLEFVSSTATTASLVWNDETWATGYRLYRSNSENGTYSIVYEGSNTSYTDSGLSPNTIYYYKLAAYDADAETPKSSYVIVNTKMPPASLAFGSVSLDSDEKGSLTAAVFGSDWAEITGKTVTFSVYSGEKEITVNPESTVVGSIYTRYQNNNYYFDIPITFDKIGGYGDVSYTVKGKIDNNLFMYNYIDSRVPATPSGLSSARTSTVSVELLWNKAEAALYYKLYRSAEIDGVYVNIGETPKTSFTDNNTTAGTVYYYKIAGVNNKGESVLSDAVSAIARNSIALNKPAISSQEYSLTPGSNAVDGDPDTMWRNMSSDLNRFVWLVVDLGGSRNVDTVILDTFRCDLIADYSIQYSDDGISWINAYAQNTQPTNRLTEKLDPISGWNVKSSLEIIRFNSVSARFIRVYMNKFYPDSSTRPWIGLYSVDVYGDGNPVDIDGQYSSDYELPQKIVIPGSNLKFSTIKHDYELILSNSVVMEVYKRVPEQKVYINGNETSSLIINSDALKIRDEKVEVSVVSKDNTRSVKYILNISSVRSPAEDNSFKLAWNDEFDGTMLDTDLWNFRDDCRVFTNNGGTVSSANMPQNVSVSNGNMHIALKKENVNVNGVTYNYTTGGIISKVGLGYGYYETRAKLWGSKGFHSSFWTMGTKGIPSVNEIDGFEIDSHLSKKVTQNLHHYSPMHVDLFSANLPAYSDVIDSSADYHIYGFEWTPTKVRFFVDGVLTNEADYVGPHLPQNMWLTSLAYTYPIDDRLLPGEVSYDYFRYYYKEYNGLKQPQNAIIIDRLDNGYQEIGNWSRQINSYSYDVAELFTKDNGVNELSKFDGYGYNENSYKRTSVISKNPGDTVSWAKELSDAGIYDVFVWNSSSNDNLAREAKYTVTYNNGEKDITVDPYYSGQRWINLGRYYFNQGDVGSVKLTVAEAAYTGADAVMFVKLTETPAKLKVNTEADEAVTISWKAVQGATGYNIYLSTSENATDQKLQTVTNQTYYTYSGLKDGLTYSFKVTSLNGWVESEKSLAIKLTPKKVPTDGQSSDDKDNDEDSNEEHVKKQVEKLKQKLLHKFSRKTFLLQQN